MRIGIDLGGTKTEIIALDDNSNELLRKRTATPSLKNSPNGDIYPLIIANICAMIDDCQKQLNSKGSIGIGIPGSISPTTGLIRNANTTCLIGQSLDKDLQRALGAPVRIANDADCFALSEFVDGAGMPFNNIFAVIMGTGVGGGLVINDHLVQGPNAISGEWGHNPLPWVKDCDLPQQQCYCKKTGCIETYLSGPGMSRQFSLQNSNKLLSSKEIVQALDQNNTLVESYWAQYIDRVARSLASVINIVDPEAVILGGGLSNIDVLYDQLPSAIDQYVFSDACTTPILKAKHSDSSGVRGAAWLWR